jgi:hypothetical protein
MIDRRRRAKGDATLAMLIHRRSDEPSGVCVAQGVFTCCVLLVPYLSRYGRVPSDGHAGVKKLSSYHLPVPGSMEHVRAWGPAAAFRLRGELSVISRIASSFASSLTLVGILCRRPMIRLHSQVAGHLFGTGTPRYSTPFRYNPWTEKENEISRNV